jgi:hypothetical protein
MPNSSYEVRPGQITFPIEPPVKIGPEGSYVDLSVRAEHLIDALDAIGQRNIRLGFDVAANATQYNRPIKERYRGALESVKMGAADNVERFEADAKQGLWRATGYIAMRSMKPRPISQAEINVRAKKMWWDFEHLYGHSEDGEKKRRKYRNQLEKTIERLDETSGTRAA